MQSRGWHGSGEVEGGGLGGILTRSCALGRSADTSATLPQGDSAHRHVHEEDVRLRGADRRRLPSGRVQHEPGARFVECCLLAGMDVICSSCWTVLFCS